jgi:hypothetical protein
MMAHHTAVICRWSLSGEREFATEVPNGSAVGNQGVMTRVTVKSEDPSEDGNRVRTCDGEYI